MVLKARPDPIRVVVVDDSPTVRELLVAILQDAGIQVVGVGADGEDAVRLTKRLRPAVVTMDIRMPRLDGLTATQRIMHDTPTPIVIVTGNQVWADRDLSFEALRAGALTVVGTPGLHDPEACEQVIQAVRLMADVPVVHHWSREPQLAVPVLPAAPARSGNDHPRVQVIGIAASTGGPAALAAVLDVLPADFPAPILVVQHVTRGFTAGLVEWLAGQTPLRVALAGQGDRLQPGTVLIAPDDYHLQVNAQRVVELSQGPPYKGLRPSANYLFRSLARAYGQRAAGLILTGMGDDGVDGLAALHRVGGLTIAQDETSCVVYGMPREAQARHVVDRVLPLEQMAAVLNQLV